LELEKCLIELLTASSLDLLTAARASRVASSCSILETVLRIDSRAEAIVKTMERTAKIAERIVGKCECNLVVGSDCPEGKDRRQWYCTAKWVDAIKEESQESLGLGIYRGGVSLVEGLMSMGALVQ
jgi:hypothetical protein